MSDWVNIGSLSSVTIGNDCLTSSEVLITDRSQLMIAIGEHFAGYLPAFIWNLRFARVGSFDQSHQQLAALGLHLRRHLSYWTLVLPVSVLPKRLAYPFFARSLITCRITRIIDGLRTGRPYGNGLQGRH